MLCRAAGPTLSVAKEVISFARDRDIDLRSPMDVKNHIVNTAYDRGDSFGVKIVYNGVDATDSGDNKGAVSIILRRLFSAGLRC